MLRRRSLGHSLSRFRVWRSSVLFALALVIVVLGSSVTYAAQLTLVWVDTSGGQAAISIERKAGITGTYAKIAQQPAGASSYVDSTVTPGPTYCYRLQAFDSAGTSGYSNEACASSAPVAQLALNWVDTSGGQAAFSIERKTGTIGAYAAIAQQPAGTSSYVDSTVTSGTTYCYRVQAFDDAGASGYSNEACASAAGGFKLSVAKDGTGTGTVTSNPPGMNCGTVCSQTYPGGRLVTLTATAGSGATFTGWSGRCNGTSPCSLTGNSPVVVRATFVANASPDPKLSVHKIGPGTITSSPSGLRCGRTCTASYANDTVVTLTAVPAHGAVFKGWNGAGCEGTGTCSVMLSTNRSVSTTFEVATK